MKREKNSKQPGLVAEPATEVKRKRKKEAITEVPAPASAPAKVRSKKQAESTDTPYIAPSKAAAKKRKIPAVATLAVTAVDASQETATKQPGAQAKLAKEQGERTAVGEGTRLQAGTEGAAGEEQGITGKGKKRRRKEAADESSLPPEERERRQRQRELRDRALKLRAQGQNYNPKRARRQKEREKERGHKPRRAVQVIIVPIYWQKKQEESDQVLEAAQQAQQILRDVNIKCDTDTTNERTPGQKFRYWEERGVRLRVELGPKEAASGRCVLARCRNHGEVADKQTLQVGKALVSAVHAALGIPEGAQQGAALEGLESSGQQQQNGGLTAGEAPREAEANGQEELRQQQKEKKRKKVKLQQPEQQQQQEEQNRKQSQGREKLSKTAAKGVVEPDPGRQQQQAQPQQRLQPVGGSSGDALIDDFAGLQEQQQQGGGGKKKGGKKGRAGPSVGLAGQDAEGLKVLLGQGEPKAAKAPKVVKF
ncbi:hypothetical protein N2152v2_000766 [Parachlorella kessleri]